MPAKKAINLNVNISELSLPHKMYISGGNAQNKRTRYQIPLFALLIQTRSNTDAISMGNIGNGLSSTTTILLLRNQHESNKIDHSVFVTL